MGGPIFLSHSVTAVCSNGDKATRGEKQAQEERNKRKKVQSEASTPHQASSAHNSLTSLIFSVPTTCQVACLLDWSSRLLSQKVMVIIDKCPHFHPTLSIYALWEVEEISGLNVHLCWSLGNHRAKSGITPVTGDLSFWTKATKIWLEFCLLYETKAPVILQPVVNLDNLCRLCLLSALSSVNVHKWSCADCEGRLNADVLSYKWIIRITITTESV